MKEAGMLIGVEPKLRQEFVQLCLKYDITTAQALRDYMYDFMRTYQAKALVKNKLKISKNSAT